MTDSSTPTLSSEPLFSVQTLLHFSSENEEHLCNSLYFGYSLLSQFCFLLCFAAERKKKAPTIFNFWWFSWLLEGGVLVVEERRKWLICVLLILQACLRMHFLKKGIALLLLDSVRKRKQSLFIGKSTIPLSLLFTLKVSHMFLLCYFSFPVLQKKILLCSCKLFNGAGSKQRLPVVAD